MKITQETKVLKAGKDDCDHIFMSDGSGSIGMFPMSHTLTRICFLCGQLEVLHTYRDSTTPFTFKSVVQRFHTEG